jgi:peptidoglycan/xylan/chitin deacetylase (PgdA/CDA1 family)
MFRFIRSPKLLRKMLTSVVWDIRTENKTLFLTFDDGPSERTLELLNVLDAYNAKATFFCVGQNVLKHPLEFNEMLRRGHRIGNHSNTHCKGWRMTRFDYLTDVERANQLIQSNLFRPPYGKMTYGQYLALKRKFRIVLWTHLSYDFDNRIPNDYFLTCLKSDYRGGEIVVIHDNLKYFDRSIEVLSGILNWTKGQGITCEVIPD